jgi:23S rRNA (adenine2503-C2)-methyltransferase
VIFLQAVTPVDMSAAIPGVTVEQARKIVSAVHRFDCLPRCVRTVRRQSLEAVRAAGVLPSLQIRAVHQSRIDPFVKYAPETLDGCLVETVRIPLERAGRFSVCVSSQAGCGLDCAFCATGRAGLHRNLQAWEIVEQVRIVRRDLNRSLGQRVHGVVFQGMGEPLANLENVLQAIRVLADPSAQAIDGRAMTVCTAGIPDGIRRLALGAPKARLAVSIGSARPELRRTLMPIDSAFPLESVLEAAAEHARITGLAPMWAVTLLSGVNDTAEDAQALARAAAVFQRDAGLKPQIRIVAYNSIDAPELDPFKCSEPGAEAAFRDILRDAGYCTAKRYSGGSDVRAACGQLRTAVRSQESAPGCRGSRANQKLWIYQFR